MFDSLITAVVVNLCRLMKLNWIVNSIDEDEESCGEHMYNKSQTRLGDNGTFLSFFENIKDILYSIKLTKI